MQIAPFEIERFYLRHEFAAEHMLSSSDCESRTVRELLELEPGALDRLLELRCGYTESPGAPPLREAIAATYSAVDPDDVLVLACAEEGIFAAYHALLGPGDHAIVETPCYGSALDVARSTGADVSCWERRFGDGWAHDLDALHALVRPATKLLYVNTPHNPTGLQMSRTVFDAVAEVAREHDLLLFSDEVYRGLEPAPEQRLPAACDVYDRALSLGSVSKAHGLPGLRLGWIATRDAAALARVLDFKLYTTICSSAPSEVLVEVAVRHQDALFAESRARVERNLAAADGFFARHDDVLDWVRPNVGPIGFPALLTGEAVESLCERLVEEESTVLLPGSVYGVAGHFRMGFGRAGFDEALGRFERFLAR